MVIDPILLVYAVPLLLLWFGWYLFGQKRTLKARAVLEDNIQAGLTEPASLHPVIDPALCLGCAACVLACPEKTVLGVIDGKAALIEPTFCVGHGACQAACPTNAISLVFGTETRGVDIPTLTPEFETTVPGIFIAGELGGMGLIKNAIEQGRQAIDAIAGRVKGAGGGKSDNLDLVIIGCGPAGLSASLAAMERKLSFITLDQSTLGGTVAHFPRGKLVMTSPAQLPIIGKVRFGEISKEDLLAFWESVLRQTGLQPQFEEQVTSVRPHDGYFEICTVKGTYQCSNVLLTIGRRGTPRTLGVPGEDIPKVAYRMIDPEQYAGKRVMVVGGGDSALEAAAEIADQPGSTVVLSYRGAAYSRARAKNRDRVRRAVAQGRITEMFESKLHAIAVDFVTLEWNGETREIANDSVIICAGGLLPSQFLQDMGIEFETKHGIA